MTASHTIYPSPINIRTIITTSQNITKKPQLPTNPTIKHQLTSDLKLIKRITQLYSDIKTTETTPKIKTTIYSAKIKSKINILLASSILKIQKNGKSKEVQPQPKENNQTSNSQIRLNKK